VTPDQVEKINVAAELGKLSVALRSASQVAASTPEPVKPQWAGDVSPALLGAAQPKAVAVKAVSVQIFRGRITDKDLRSEIIKPEADTKDDKNR
jgi:Flp pilus assembly protein CpaB